MNIQGNFIRHGRVDSANLKGIVCALREEEWDADPFRQRAYKAHRDTQTVNLVFDYDFRHTEPTLHPMYHTLAPQLDPIFKAIAKLRDWRGNIIRVLLARLKAGGAIASHVDQGFSLMHSHRLHIPIVSNELVTFTIEDERICMREGEVWEINNARKHSVTNQGAEPRVHLIVDVALPITKEQEQEYAMDRIRFAAAVAGGAVPKFD